jgi:hypothetical protein
MTFSSMDKCYDRDLECEASLEVEFQALVDRAVSDGWTADEVANALLSLAQARVETMRADAVIGSTGIAGRVAH